MRDDRTENKASMKGEARDRPNAGSESIKSEEHVGSSGSHGVRFKIPEGCCRPFESEIDEVRSLKDFLAKLMGKPKPVPFRALKRK